jgi:murein DD-endopeptidase MepM/ murein hydrolase activator NlpD
VMARPLGPYGNVTVVDHGSGLASVYAHQAGIITAEGASVAKGELIGFVGTTGRSSSPHLHFEVRIHGTPVAPLVYLQ